MIQLPSAVVRSRGVFSSLNQKFWSFKIGWIIVVGLDKGYGLTKPWYGCPVMKAISCQAANSIRRLRLLSANWARSISAPPPPLLPPPPPPPPSPLGPTSAPTSYSARASSSHSSLAPTHTPLCVSPRTWPSAQLNCLNQTFPRQTTIDKTCSHCQLCW